MRLPRSVAVAQVRAGHQVGLYPVVDLQRALRLEPRRLHVRRVLFGELGQQLAHQLLHIAVDHALPAVHDRVHEAVAAAHEPVLHVDGVVVPVHDPRRYGVHGERANEFPVPDVSAALHRQPALLADRLPQAGARVELGAREVHLAQVPRVVHVEQQEVHVRGQARGRERGRVQYVHVLLEQRACGRAPEGPSEVVHLKHPVQQHHHQQRGHRDRVRVAREQVKHFFFLLFLLVKFFLFFPSKILRVVRSVRFGSERTVARENDGARNLGKFPRKRNHYSRLRREIFFSLEGSARSRKFTKNERIETVRFRCHDTIL